MKKFLSILIAFLFALTVEAKITVQLFTTAPYQEYVFTAWGHSALRVMDDEEGSDVIYNYGVFSFDDVAKFVCNFVKGDTDYMLEAKYCKFGGATDRVLNSKRVNLRVQTLDLTQEEALSLKQALNENADIEDWTYRYNFFYDNCATRPRMMIENNTGAKFDYQFKNENKKSYRDIIHELLNDSKWYALGIDICLGAPCDEVPDDSLLMFLPEALADQMADAYIIDSLGQRKLVKEDVVHNPEVYRHYEDLNFPCPLLLFWVLLFLVIAHTIFYYYMGKDDYKWFDFVFYSLLGLVGILVFFLQFISTHPCVMPNINILWANPLLLLVPILILWKSQRKNLEALHISNIGMLMTCTLLVVFGLQVFNYAVYPIMLASLVRSISYILRYGEITNRILRKVRKI